MLRKIISGGQTGADRGGLNAALLLGIEHGGFCPRGRRAEDGVIPSQYLLTETPSSQYPPRTALNVRDSDGTLILVHGKAALARSRGTLLTIKIIRQYDRPWWAADPRREDHADRVVAWLLETGIEILNVAGPRESRSPGIEAEVCTFLCKVIEKLSTCSGNDTVV